MRREEARALLWYHNRVMSRQRPHTGVNYFIPVFLWIAIGLAPLVETPNALGPSLLPAPAREYLLELLVLGLGGVFTFLSIKRAWTWSGARVWQNTAGPYVLLLFAWGSFGLFQSPYPKFAFAEWLRTLFCFGIFAVAAYGLTREQIRRTINGFVVLGAGMAMYGLLQFGMARSAGETESFDRVLGLFGDNENFGSFLMLLLPLAAQEALTRNSPELRRLGSQAAALLMLIALVVSGTRSAWIGEVFALTVMGLLFVRERGHAPLPQRRQWGLVFATIAVVVLGALVAGNSTRMVSDRALSLANTRNLYSFTDRVHKSDAALRMAEARPLTGWGLGTWPVVQQRWTGEGDTLAQVFARQDIWSRGGDQQSLAHDFYAQWAAETGFSGLFCYAAAFAAFFFFALRRLPRVRSPQMRSVLIACLAAAAGGCLDALTSPAYNFPGVSGLLWLCVGLGTAASLDT